MPAMEQTLSLTGRFGQVRAQAIFVIAAILGAHCALPNDQGFRPSDVRFFFLLFTNWIERDLERPGHDIDLTQVRRALEALVKADQAKSIAPRKGERRTRYLLSTTGIVALAEELFAPDRPRPFEEDLFVACFAACYGGALTARVHSGVALAAPSRRRVAELCDPRRIIQRAARATDARIRDLEERIRSSLALVDDATRARAAGARESEIAKRMEASGAYQLHHVRPFADLAASLPDDIREFELGAAMQIRARLLFEPLEKAARGERALWNSLMEKLEQGTLVPSAPSHRAKKK